MSSGRVLRVAQLLSADAAAVTGLVTGLRGRVTGAVAELPVGTLLTLELHRRWWDRRPRRLVLARLAGRLADIERRTERQLIVAAALMVGGSVLVAQRAQPPELAGQWEFPGGKVERGETPRRALARECAEELGCSVTVGEELAREQLPDGALLLLFQVELSPQSAQPRALEHREIRWARPAELAELEWVVTNRRFATEVTARL